MLNIGHCVIRDSGILPPFLEMILYYNLNNCESMYNNRGGNYEMEVLAARFSTGNHELSGYC